MVSLVYKTKQMREMKHTKYNVYLDDVRTPFGDAWLIPRNYDEFVKLIKEIGIKNIDNISLDHDLADEHYRPSMYNSDGHYSNYYLDGTFKEKTGYECAKFLIDHCLDEKLKLPQIYVHSMNPIGTKNIIALVNNAYKHMEIDLTCKAVNIPHKIEENLE